MSRLSRRAWICLLPAIATGARNTIHKNLLFRRHFQELEQASGGRLGIAILDTASQSRISYRADERFPLCSTFKLLAVAAVLARVDRGRESLSRIVRFRHEDLVAHSPVTEQHAGAGGISLRTLCAAAMTVSDNTAGNLLLDSLSGPSSVTAFARSLGDRVTRLDRRELELNQALPDDPRDTTSPAAMLANLRHLILGTALSPHSRSQLTQWFVHNETGCERLRAGVPSKWKAGDKTGTGERGTSNDIAVFWPPRRAPIIAAVYLTGSSQDDDHRNATIAAVGKAISGASPP